MTQREIDHIASVMNDATAQLHIAKGKIDMQERLLKTQDELIDVLKATIANRDKYIAILEGQLAATDQAIEIAKTEFKRQLNG